MPYNQTTRAQLRTLLENQLDSLALAFWRVDEKNRLIQDGLRFWNLLTGYWKARAITNTTANTVWYALPGALTSSLRVSWRDFPLSPTSFHDLDLGRPQWESETTTTGGDVPTRPMCWVIGGINLIGIWPADAVGGNSLVIDGIANTPILAADNDPVDLAPDELNSLLNYLQHIASFKEGGKEWQATDDEFQAFLAAAGQCSAILRASATYRKWLGLDKSRYSKKTESDDASPGAR